MTATSPPSAPGLVPARTVLDVRLADPDRVLEHVGLDPLHLYCERFWLPIVGPTTLLLGRHLHRATWLAGMGPGDRLVLDAHDLGASLGVGHSGGKNSPLARALARLCSFGLAAHAYQDPFTLALPAKWPPLPLRMQGRLPAHLRELHEALADGRRVS